MNDPGPAPAVSLPQAVAVIAAVQCFIRDTAPPPTAQAPAIAPWTRAGLLESAGHAADAMPPWVHPQLRQ